MKITRVRIKNFRSIRDLDLPLGTTTVLIGPNNCGKSSVLDALRIALTRRWGQRGTGFTEYDFRLAGDDSDPKTAPPIQIEVELAEEQQGEWGEDLLSDLDEILQVDPISGQAAIILRVSCAWDDVEESFVPKWEFLGSTGAPLTGKGARLVNMSRFFEYIPVFVLDALRDAGDEFSSRSQFWGRLLKAVTIPPTLAKRSQQVLDALNRRLLGADPKVGNIATKLEGISKVAAEDEPGGVDVRMVPLKTWDLLSRAEVILKTTKDHPWLPLTRHGRGVQSLSVVFLFHAFVAELLASLFHADSEPFLALEEPEAHLHPQAARTLWKHINALPGQKIVTTHSPYFVQHVPFREIRLLRADKDGTRFTSLPSTFSIAVPKAPQLKAYVALHSELSYDERVGRLVVKGTMDPKHVAAITACYSSDPRRDEIRQDVEALRRESLSFVPDHVLADLDNYARRVRGEIFFAKRWLLVEGQSDYHLAHAVGDACGYPLDANGVAVIDCANNGNPFSFAVLARALGIPWLGVFDNDPAGEEYVEQISKRGFDNDEIAERCDLHVHGDTEEELLRTAGEHFVREVAGAIGVRDASASPVTRLMTSVRKRKVIFALEVTRRLAEDSNLVSSMPPKFVSAVQQLRGLG